MGNCCFNINLNAERFIISIMNETYLKQLTYTDFEKELKTRYKTDFINKYSFLSEITKKFYSHDYNNKNIDYLDSIFQDIIIIDEQTKKVYIYYILLAVFSCVKNKGLEDFYNLIVNISNYTSNNSTYNSNKFETIHNCDCPITPISISISRKKMRSILQIYLEINLTMITQSVHFVALNKAYPDCDLAELQELVFKFSRFNVERFLDDIILEKSQKRVSYRSNGGNSTNSTVSVQDEMMNFEDFKDVLNESAGFLFEFKFLRMKFGEYIRRMEFNDNDNDNDIEDVSIKSGLYDK